MVKHKKYFQGEAKKELGLIDLSDFTEDELENARLAFAADSRFLISVVAHDGFPFHQKKEVAFAGRSNVGKSSLINSITNVSGLARVSNTPGRTQMINFFSQRDDFFIVDLPGFGYAKASKESIKQWSLLTKEYLLGRKELEIVLAKNKDFNSKEGKEHPAGGVCDRCTEEGIQVHTRGRPK